jgi:hypothetical protein
MIRLDVMGLVGMTRHVIPLSPPPLFPLPSGLNNVQAHGHADVETKNKMQCRVHARPCT